MAVIRKPHFPEITQFVCDLIRRHGRGAAHESSAATVGVEERQKSGKKYR
jgi:hypothetical protein